MLAESHRQLLKPAKHWRKTSWETVVPGAASVTFNGIIQQLLATGGHPVKNVVLKSELVQDVVANSNAPPIEVNPAVRPSNREFA